MYKVLVCDDEKDIVSAISIYLTSDGYEVIPARNGLEALDTKECTPALKYRRTTSGITRPTATSCAPTARFWSA